MEGRMNARLTNPVVLPVAFMWQVAPASAVTCESLTALSSPDATITVAQKVPCESV
jgi:hypothetical protein